MICLCLYKSCQRGKLMMYSNKNKFPDWYLRIYISCQFYLSFSKHFSHYLYLNRIFQEYLIQLYTPVFPLMIFIAFLQGRGLQVSQVKLIWLCAQDFIFFITLNSTLLPLLSLFLPHVVYSSLFAARSPGEIKVNLQRYIPISRPPPILFFYCCCQSLHLFLLLYSNVTNKPQKNKCRPLAVQRMQSCRNDEQRTGRRAFAVSVLFTVISSDFSSCFFVCLQLFHSFFS